ncbi:YEATS domain-containing protein 2-like [Stylophora pistillata]|nr:YEATS domain-containing protein 2-like [Stylophora pistillata]
MEDPDYESASSNQRERERRILTSRQRDAKEQTIQKIDEIIRQQFALEIHLKEREIVVIDDRIGHAKAMLDRLRACVLARYYGSSENRGNQSSNRSYFKNEGHDRRKSGRNLAKRVDFQMNPLNKNPTKETITSTSNFKSEATEPLEVKKSTASETTISANDQLIGSKNHLIDAVLHTRQENCSSTPNGTTACGEPVLWGHIIKEDHSKKSNPETGNGITQNCLEPSSSQENSPIATASVSNATPMVVASAGSRFYIKKRIIVGNTSKYISIDRREDYDKSTHKWMVYVRGPPEDPNIDRFIKKVWFFLHPSYRPNDIVEVNKPPFHLTRRGWGEFTVRVQLHFVDPRNKRADIFHELKLDRTYTGLQTLGSETVVDLELDRRTIDDNYISAAVESFSPHAHHEHDNNVVRNTARNLQNNRNQLQHETLPTVRKCSNAPEMSSQYPPLKKVKLESVSASSSVISSAVSSPVNSQPSSRCGSPELISGQNQFTEELKEQLRQRVKEHPLIDPARNLVKHHYSAASSEQFLSWNIGKKRACEWQRAAAVKRSILTSMPSCKLSVKDILLWCRRFGYTPSDKVLVEDVSFCKLCGGCLGVQSEVPSEVSEGHRCDKASYNCLTLSATLFSEVGLKERCLPDIPRPDNDSEDLEIDVVGDIPREKATKPQDGKPVMYTIPSTSEQNWIREMCSDIGVKLKTVHTDGVNVHVIESLLLTACKRFAEDLLRQSWAYAADQTTSYGPRLVTPSHVHRAICSLPQCDFLTSVFLGEILLKEER